MNQLFLKAFALGMLIASSAAFAGPNGAQRFFDFANDGKYIDIINLVKTGQIVSDDLYIQRDAHGNTLISAAIQGYPLAIANFGDAKAEEYLGTILIKTLLPMLPNTGAVKELLNLENAQKMTALLYAGQNGLLKLATQLHSKGADPILADGSKKMSDFTPNLKNTTIARSWEKYQMDNVEMAGDKFREAGDDIKEAFTGGADVDSTLALKIADLKKKPPVAEAPQAAPAADSTATGAGTTESTTDKVKNAGVGLLNKFK